MSSTFKSFVSWAENKYAPVFEGKVHKFDLIKTKSGKCYKSITCPKCGNKSALVGRSKSDANVYVCLCPTTFVGGCGKATISRSNTKGKEGAKPTPPPSKVNNGICMAVKKDGTGCTNKAKPGSRYCGVHKNHKPLF